MKLAAVFAAGAVLAWIVAEEVHRSEMRRIRRMFQPRWQPVESDGALAA